MHATCNKMGSKNSQPSNAINLHLYTARNLRAGVSERAGEPPLQTLLWRICPHSHTASRSRPSITPSLPSHGSYISHRLFELIFEDTSMVSFHLNQYIPSPDEAFCLECKQSWDFASPPMTTSKAYIELNIMQRIGPVRVRRLTEAFGSPATVLTTPIARFQAVSTIGPEAAKALTNWDSRVDFPS